MKWGRTHNTGEDQRGRLRCWSHSSTGGSQSHMDGWGCKRYETREIQTEHQGMSPGSKKGGGATGPKMALQRWGVPAKGGQLEKKQEAASGERIQGVGTLWVTLLERQKGCPTQGGGENQAWGHRERTKGVPLWARWMYDQTPSRCCWSSQHNQMMSPQLRPNKVQGAGKVNLGPRGVWDLKTVFQHWMKGVSQGIEGPGESGKVL